jgi:hypothetical protein
MVLAVSLPAGTGPVDGQPEQTPNTNPWALEPLRGKGAGCLSTGPASGRPLLEELPALTGRTQVSFEPPLR